MKLAETIFKRQGTKYRLTVRGGLHYIKGNSSPHFSITADLDEMRGGQFRDYSGGCLHDEILKKFPRFSDLVALHLSDMDGTPIHAAGNGFFWAAGACGGLGQEYHGGNGSSAKTPVQCFEIFAEYLRLPRDKARTVLSLMKLSNDPKAYLEQFCAEQAERWAAEAKACIEKHGLEVYGDEWKGK